MKKSILILMTLCSACIINSCKEKEADDMHHHDDTSLSYHIHVHNINTAYTQADTLKLNVDFEEHHGGKVHHINVSLFSISDTLNALYSKPAEAHVHADGSYNFIDNVALSAFSKGVYLLKAKVWGHEANTDEVIERNIFEIN